MNKPSIRIGCASNIYIRMMHFHNAGDIEEGHAHQFDHISFLTNGSIRVIVEGIEKSFKAPHMILIVKNKHHQMIALEDNTIMNCIHALRDLDGEILDPDQIPHDSNPRLKDHDGMF